MTYEAAGQIPMFGLVGPSGTYKVNPAGVYLSQQPGIKKQ